MPMPASSSALFSSMPDTPASSSLVEFKDVTFSYPGSAGDRVILDRMSLCCG